MRGGLFSGGIIDIMKRPFATNGRNNEILRCKTMKMSDFGTPSQIILRVLQGALIGLRPER